MIMMNNLYRFYSGGSPDWPPCDKCRNGGETGDEKSSKTLTAEYAVVSNVG